MKKYLLSAATLATLAVLAAPSVANAAPDEKEVETRVGVSFGDDKVVPKGRWEGNLVMGYVPADINFTKDGAGLELEQGVGLYNANEWTKTRYLVINDDRAGTTTATDKWEVTASLAEFTLSDGSQPASPLDADILLQDDGIKKYAVGAFNETNADYDPVVPSETTVTEDYAGTSVTSKSVESDLAGKKDFTLPATDASIKILERNETAETGFSGIERGKKQGGHGYALTFSKPRLKVRSGAAVNTDYKSVLTWKVTFDDPSKD